jgi:hypothetical protein
MQINWTTTYNGYIDLIIKANNTIGAGDAYEIKDNKEFIDVATTYRIRRVIIHYIHDFK